ALFNVSDAPQEVSVPLTDLGISGMAKATDLWTGTTGAKMSVKVSVTLKPHSSVLYKLTTK
ncbi:MAG: alpha-galactosidase, partial [Bacteroidota bacterium]